MPQFSKRLGLHLLTHSPSLLCPGSISNGTPKVCERWPRPLRLPRACRRAPPRTPSRSARVSFLPIQKQPLSTDRWMTFTHHPHHQHHRPQLPQPSLLQLQPPQHLLLGNGSRREAAAATTGCTVSQKRLCCRVARGGCTCTDLHEPVCPRGQMPELDTSLDIGIYKALAPPLLSDSLATTTL